MAHDPTAQLSEEPKQEVGVERGEQKSHLVAPPLARVVVSEVAPFDVTSLVAVGASLFPSMSTAASPVIPAESQSQSPRAAAITNGPEVAISANGRSFHVAQLQEPSYVLFRKPIFRLNFLITGEAGLGKTTFQKNLFGLYTGRVEFHDGASTSIEDFRHAPHRLSRQITIESRDAIAQYHLQDTPGFGETNDLGEYIKMIQSYITSLDRQFLALAEDPTRLEPLTSEEDCRVDLCLFFIPAHRIKQMDLNLMKAVTALGVPVLPIIAKADTMTVDETRRFKTQIQRKAREQELEFFSFTKEEQLAALEMCRQRSACFIRQLHQRGVVESFQDMVIPQSPYAIICSNTCVAGATADAFEDKETAAAAFMPVREYKWGACYPLAPSHSDFGFLRSLIMEKGIHRIKQSTEKRYFRLRSQHNRWHLWALRRIQCAAFPVSGRDIVGVCKSKDTHSSCSWSWLRRLVSTVFTSVLVACVAVMVAFSLGAINVSLGTLGSAPDDLQRLLCTPFVSQLQIAATNASRCHQREQALEAAHDLESAKWKQQLSRLASENEATQANKEETLRMCRQQTKKHHRQLDECRATLADKSNCWL